MSLKRKAEESPPGSGYADAGPAVSAFAAARQRIFGNPPGYQTAMETSMRSKQVFAGQPVARPVAQPVVLHPSGDQATGAREPLQSDPKYDSVDDDYDFDEFDDAIRAIGAVPDDQEARVRAGAELSNWSCHGDNILSKDPLQLTLRLRPQETVVHIGVYDLYVEAGCITVNGAVFYTNKQPQRVFALPTHSLPAVHAIGTTPAIVRFATCSSMKMLEQLSPLYANIWNYKTWGGYQRSFAPVFRGAKDELMRPLFSVVAPSSGFVPKLFVGDSPVVMVTGPKTSGKNTFANCAVNQMFTLSDRALFYLDLDADKPEYTPQGQISLVAVRKLNLGPSYTHPAPIPDDKKDNHIIWSHPMPLNGITEYSEYFFLCVVDLMQRYRALRFSHHRAALVVNTPAWGFMNGIEPFLQAICCIRPTKIVHIFSEEPNLRYMPLIREACEKEGVDFCSIEAQPNAIALRTDRNLIRMDMMAYFHCQDVDEASGQRIYNATTLSRMNPWHVYYGTDPSNTLDFIGVLMLSDWTDPSCIATILHGSLITIVETSDPEVQAQYGKLPRTPEDVSIRAHYGEDSFIPSEMAGIPYFPPDQNNVVSPPNPATTKVVCTALIRGFDPESQSLEVLIPPTHSSLILALDPRKTVLVFGCCAHPEWAYIEDSHSDLMEKKEKDTTDLDYDGPGLDYDDEPRPVEEEVRAPMAPWVADAEDVKDWGRLHMPRRLRRFKPR